MNYTAKQSEALDLLGAGPRNVLLYGGSRSGKTFINVYAILCRAHKKKSKHLIVRYRFNHAKTSIWHDTLKKVIAIMGLPCHWNKSDYYVEFPIGSQVWIGGLDDKDRVEKVFGTEYSTIYFNECSQLSYPSVEDALSRLAERSGLRNMAYYDCNPPSKRHWTHKVFVEKMNPTDNVPLPDPNNYASMLMNPQDNADNISEDYIQNVLMAMSERRRKRFLLGEWTDDNEKALWNDAMISAFRVTTDKVPDLSRIVVGVDPAVTAKPDSDETGIVCVGCDASGHGYVLDDRSLVAKPLAWAREVVASYYQNKADRIVGEVNNGGDLVEANLRTVDPNIAYSSVHASRGKYTRAEPVAALYEQGRIHHVGEFTELEDQMCSWSPEEEDSPDRIDACLVAGTMIATESGEKPIEQIKKGDMVLTRIGYRMVREAKRTGENMRVMTLRTSKGRMIEATPEHRIYIDAKGWVMIDKLCPCDTLVCVVNKEDSAWQKAKKKLCSTAYGMSSVIIVPIMSALISMVKCCTELCGSIITGLFQKDALSIMPTATKRITGLRILNASHLRSTHSGTPEDVRMLCGTTLRELDRSQKHGTHQKRAAHGIESMGANHGKAEIQSTMGIAKSVARLLSHISSELGIARRSAAVWCSIVWGVIKSVWRAQYAVESLAEISTNIGQQLAADYVEQLYESSERKDVYNLEVDGMPEYFANGILVHNCVWAITELGLTNATLSVTNIASDDEPIPETLEDAQRAVMHDESAWDRL